MTSLVSPAIFNVDMPALNVMSRYLMTTFDVSNFFATALIAHMAEQAVSRSEEFGIEGAWDLTSVLHRAVDELTEDEVRENVRQHRALCLELGLDLNMLED